MGSPSPKLIAAVCLLGLGNLLHIVGVATYSWVTIADGSVGLWGGCYDSVCSTDSGSVSSNLMAVRAMVILGALCGGSAAILAFVMLIFQVTGRDSNPLLPTASLSASLAAVVFILIGVIIYATNIYVSEFEDYGYSFGLCIVGAILIPIGGGLAMAGKPS